ncbi:hypothetical protein [Mariprofundus ferrooxydans]|uniref:Uncharacterized protein n=1 Tax=Mariprofundus ferrooxydans PV-1 TaxID=314345 RepID=Q0EWB3_9PROT|nr:hypothetical protein [Mariprofundus ferrooxydans]EAU53558.1 hypothetical protein SPV1_02933 [Mariprofundus ferrooxydans PV-1]KON46996.1 hypothetical protein AL013_10405 [Mariprofundus ferrooxydans]
MNNLACKWRVAPTTNISDFTIEQITDDRINMLGVRFQANRIFALMGLTFVEYLESPRQYDRIAAHLDAGGGCRREGGELVINTPAPRAGECGWCERFWSMASGGLDEKDLCPECRRSFIRSRLYSTQTRREQRHAHG